MIYLANLTDNARLKHADDFQAILDEDAQTLTVISGWWERSEPDGAGGMNPVRYGAGAEAKFESLWNQLTINDPSPVWEGKRIGGPVTWEILYGDF